MKHLETYKGVDIYIGINRLGDESYIFYMKNGLQCSCCTKLYTLKRVKYYITRNINLGNIIIKEC